MLSNLFIWLACTQMQICTLTVRHTITPATTLSSSEVTFCSTRESLTVVHNAHRQTVTWLITGLGKLLYDHAKTCMISPMDKTCFCWIYLPSMWVSPMNHYIQWCLCISTYMYIRRNCISFLCLHYVSTQQETWRSSSSSATCATDTQTVSMSPKIPLSWTLESCHAVQVTV